jgi:REP-associated tyrosine transposase
MRKTKIIKKHPTEKHPTEGSKVGNKCPLVSIILLEDFIMSLPRPYRKQTAYLLTRRTLERRFFLNPDPQTARTLLFSLAFYAKKHGIKIHAYVFMSNHVHLVVTDMRGNLPDFTRDFYSSVARVMNKKMGRRENFWACGAGGATVLIGEQTILEKMAYTITNPVAAGVVPTHTRWKLNQNHSKIPLISTLGAIKRRNCKRFLRPKNYFKLKGSAVADYGILTLEPPPGTEEEQFNLKLDYHVKQREKELQKKRKNDNKPFLGMKNTFQIKPQHIPEKKEKRSKINPQLACSDLIRLIGEKNVLKQFRYAHKECRVEILAGKNMVFFPEGTYAMLKLFSIKTAPLEFVMRKLNTR